MEVSSPEVSPRGRHVPSPRPFGLQRLLRRLWSSRHRRGRWVPPSKSETWTPSEERRGQPSGSSSEGRPVRCLRTTRGRGLAGLQTLNNAKLSSGSCGGPSGVREASGGRGAAPPGSSATSCAAAGDRLGLWRLPARQAHAAHCRPGGHHIRISSSRVQRRRAICPRSHSLEQKKIRAGTQGSRLR